jgi:hypothetical protein
MLSVLKEYGFDNEKTKEVFRVFLEEKENEIEKISDPKERMRAYFNRDIEIAELYYEAGLRKLHLKNLLRLVKLRETEGNQIFVRR